MEHSIVGKSTEKGLLEINYHNFRENAESLAMWTMSLMAGGGQGCCFRLNPYFDAYDRERSSRVLILLDPAGRTFDQTYAELAKEGTHLHLWSLREGYDERIKMLVIDEISLGD